MEGLEDEESTTSCYLIDSLAHLSWSPLQISPIKLWYSEDAVRAHAALRVAEAVG